MSQMEKPRPRREDSMCTVPLSALPSPVHGTTIGSRRSHRKRRPTTDMKRILIVTLLGVTCILGSALPAMAGSGAGAIVLSFPIGARYNALGEAGTALAQDATAAWVNPGGMAFISSRPTPHDVQIMYSKLAAGLADDIALTWAGYAGKSGSSGALGFSLTYLDMGEQTATDEEGNIKGTFSSYEYVLQGNYALKLSPNLGLGFGTHVRTRNCERFP